MRAAYVSCVSRNRDGLSIRDRWRELAGRVRVDAAPWSSAALGYLYLLALADARATLRAYRSLDDARREDLGSTAFLRAKAEIVAAADPRAYFRRALVNEANSWLRRGGAAVAEDRPAQGGRRGGDGPADDEERRAIARIDGRRALAAMPQRVRAVLLAVAGGESRDEIARRERTSRDNIDQIVHRARVRVGRAA